MKTDRAAKTDYIRARVEPALKQEVENLFNSWGITVTQAITMFYKQVRARHDLPFELNPNKETLCAIIEAIQRKGTVKCKDAQDLFNRLGM